MIGVFTLWFAVIMPGHQRGSIALPGERSVNEDGKLTEVGGASCPLCLDDEGDSGAPFEGEGPGKKDPVQKCAICYLTGVLDCPPPMDLDAVRMGVVDEVVFVWVEKVDAFEGSVVVRDRGPPRHI